MFRSLSQLRSGKKEFSQFEIVLDSDARRKKKEFDFYLREWMVLGLKALQDEGP